MELLAWARGLSANAENSKNQRSRVQKTKWPWARVGKQAWFHAFRPRVRNRNFVASISRSIDDAIRCNFIGDVIDDVIWCNFIVDCIGAVINDAIFFLRFEIATQIYQLIYIKKFSRIHIANLILDRSQIWEQLTNNLAIRYYGEDTLNNLSGNFKFDS